MIRRCKWCRRHLGIIAGWLYICPACDYNDYGGPDENRVKDQYPKP